jgi:hypothetical protein
MARGGIFPFSGFYFYTSARPHSVAAGALQREIYVEKWKKENVGDIRRRRRG